MKIRQILVLFVVFLCNVIVKSQLNPKLSCIDAGTCESCSAFEMNEDYCKATQKKMKITCRGHGTYLDDYRSCKYTAQDDQFMVFIFQLVMGFVGGLAFWGVQSRKQQNMTRFEHRKQRRPREERLREIVTT